MTNQAAASSEVNHIDQRGKFFTISSSFRGDGKGVGWDFVNYEKLRSPETKMFESPNGDPNQYPERPHLAYVKKWGRMPRDLEVLASKWVVSEVLKQVFEAIDPEGFAFAPCDFTLVDGAPGPQYYLCNVIRVIDALDESRSKVKIKYERDYQTGEDVKLYSVVGGASLNFNEKVIGDVHIFRQPRLGTDAICDITLYEAIKKACLNGVEFCDVGNL
jgi:hypothetical protein